MADREPDPREIVRRGYDALSYRYRADDAGEGHYAAWLAALRQRVPAGGAVLDLGCGAGVPVARALAADGYEVTGVDVSEVQIRRARRLVPRARFLRADATRVELPAGSFDAVVCLYTLIHLPLDEQPPLLGRVAGWLRAGGCSPPPGSGPGPAPRTAGWAARRPCGGARPAPPATGNGSSGPVWR